MYAFMPPRNTGRRQPGAQPVSPAKIASTTACWVVSTTAVPPHLSTLRGALSDVRRFGRERERERGGRSGGEHVKEEQGERKTMAGGKESAYAHTV